MKAKQLILYFFLFEAILSKAQAPGHVPYGEPDQLELTPANILFFIVLPILLFVAFYVLRRKKKKKN
jgi:hypothetical protein